MTGTPLLLIGTGGHAIACIDVIEREGRFAIAGLIAPTAETGSEVLGHKVIGTDAELATLAARYSHALVVVGQIKTAEPRVRLFGELASAGYELPTIVSPRAYVSPHATLGKGTIVMHGAIINAGAQVGDNCIINSNALLEHGVVVGDHCHVSTSATINGDARIGGRTFLGSGCVVREGITIGDGCVVGMGQSVLSGCAAGARITGVGRP